MKFTNHSLAQSKAFFFVAYFINASPICYSVLFFALLNSWSYSFSLISFLYRTRERPASAAQ